MHTIQQIIENQKVYKENILHFFLSETNDTRKELRSIKSKDKFIIKEKEKLLKKFKKLNTVESIKKYFFLTNKRDENFYVWWDEKQEESLILKYGKK